MKNKNNNKAILIVLILVLLISIGYAAVTTFIKIDSNVGLGKTTFDIHFDNIGELTNKATVTNGAHFVDEDNKKEIAFDVVLPKVGDYYAFTADMVNDSNIPAKVKSIELSNITDSQKKLIKSKITYTGTTKNVAVGDFVGAGKTKSITIELSYDLADDIDNSDILFDNVELNVIFTINFENAKLDDYRNSALSSKLFSNSNYAPSDATLYNQSANSDQYEGLYMLNDTKDDVFPIYYYRGGHEKVKNHVLFAGYCWRIIRTTETGGVKMIYNGVPTDGVCIAHPTTNDDVALPDKTYGDNNLFVGSALSRYLSAWYLENIVDYKEYLEDIPFCNSDSYENGSISLSCEAEYEYSVSNNKLTYPIGLITAEEANLCGLSTNQSSFPWLFTGKLYWTMTRFPSINERIWFVSIGGDINNGHYESGRYGYNVFTSSTLGVRPVISLNSNVEINTGTGTSTDPYIVS